MDRFKACWDDLAVRSSTKLGDRLLILSNLMQLNTFAVSGSPSPMRTLLRSMPGVPLGLLYGPETKKKTTREGAPETDHPLLEDATGPERYNKWVPDYPGSFELGSDGWMRWDDQYLHYRNVTTQTEFLLFEMPDAMKPEFLVKEESGLFRYEVEFLRHGKRVPPDTNFNVSCLVIGRDVDRDLANVFRGAHLQVYRKEDIRRPLAWGMAEPLDEPQLTITAAYDCPVRIRRTLLQPRNAGGSRRESERPHIPVKLALKLLHNCPKLDRDLHRPSTNDLTALPMFVFMAVAVPFVICEITSDVVFLILTIKSFRSLPWMIELVIVLWYAFRWLPVLLVNYHHHNLPSIAIVAAYASLKTTLVSPLSGLERWFVALVCVGFGGGYLFTETYRRLVCPDLYKEWISSYGPHPEEMTNMRWHRRMQWFKNKVQPRELEANRGASSSWH